LRPESTLDSDGVNQRSDFSSAVESAAAGLRALPEDFSDAHFHFDDPVFAGLVPHFSDLERPRLAAIAAEVVAKIPGSFLIHVAIVGMPELPDHFDLDSPDGLEPWQPPLIDLLRSRSAFDIRRGSTSRALVRRLGRLVRPAGSADIEAMRRAPAVFL
jgi:hypothetical protein